MTPERLAQMETRHNLVHARQVGLCPTCELIDALKEEKAERLRYQFMPMGDNHHNAAMCPYCGALLVREQARSAALAEALSAVNGVPRVRRNDYDAAWRKVDVALAAYEAAVEPKEIPNAAG